MSEDSIIMIYGLYDPRSDELRYVGKASDFELRLYQHIKDAKAGQKTYRSNWIRSLLELGMIPAIKLLGYSTVNSWQEDEKAWIAKVKKEGANLTNLTEGGEGILGYNHSEETRNKISQANIESGKVPPNWKGRKQSLEHIRKRVEARKKKGNYEHSEETKENISKGRTGKNLGNTNSLGYKHTEEWKKAASERTKGENNPAYGKSPSKEVKEKMSKNRKGKAIGNQSAKGSRRTVEQREAMSKARKGKPGKSVSDETKQKLREANLGKKHTPEAIQKMGEASRRYWAKKKAERSG